jgi:hypothetical protein
MSEIKSANTIEQLRTLHQVRLVENAEDGSAAAALPNGVYGFTYAPAEAAIPLFAKKSWHSFEFHKLRDGSEHLVGFVTAREAELIRQGRQAEVVLFPEPWEDATELVSLALSRIVPTRKGPAREGGNGLKLEVI